MKVYQHNLFAHIVCLGMGFVFALMGLGIAIAPHFKGTLLVHISIVLAMLLASALTLTLYFTSVVNRYETTHEGLRVQRWHRSTFYPWNEITLIKWNAGIHTLFVYAGKKRIFYSSSDCLPHVAEFLRTIHQRSNCRLSPWLEKILAHKHPHSL